MNNQTNNTPKVDWNRWTEISAPERKYRGNCRYCKHNEWQHIYSGALGACGYDENNMSVACNPSSVDIIVPRNTLSHCPCMEYVPGNNLDYLEWKAQKEGNNVR